MCPQAVSPGVFPSLCVPLYVSPSLRVPLSLCARLYVHVYLTPSLCPRLYVSPPLHAYMHDFTHGDGDITMEAEL